MNRRLENIKISFGTLFFVANRLETLIDRYLLPYQLTTKQFFLSLVLLQNKDQNPALTLGQVSQLMGTSRQNVKQLAIKLEQRGFCQITHDPSDRRIIRISITQKNTDFWEQLDDQNIKFLYEVFKNIEDGIVNSLAIGLSALLQNIETMEK